MLMSVALLSTQGTFGVLHALLHQLPNPFHYHGTEVEMAYQHEVSRSRSFFDHADHGHTHSSGFHSLEDHIAMHHKDMAKSPSKEKESKKEVKKSSQTLFWQDLASERWTASFCTKNVLFFYVSSFLVCLSGTPPSPPPENFI